MQSDIPQDFKDYACALLGAERYAPFARALTESPSVSIRLNPLKAGKAGLSPFAVCGADMPVPWAADEACYLRERPHFTSDPLFHAGAYYVQEASSMFLGRALRRYVKHPVVALDLCAAPGGKSTHIRACLPEGSLLVSNEPVKPRAQVLLENMTKWGHPDVVVTHGYPQDFSRLPHFFDLLVTDVPCSGEGMFRKEDDAVAGWSMDAVRMCRDRQREILRDVWPALKPGGLLVYSTCTLNVLEDEENVAWIADELGAEVMPLEVPEEWGVTGNLLPGAGRRSAGCADSSFPVYHFIPGLARGEGFFLAVLRKASDEGLVAVPPVGATVGDKGRRKKKKEKQSAPAAFPAVCKTWLVQSDEFDFLSVGDTWTARRKVFSQQIEQLCAALCVWQAGVPVAVAKGHDYVPLHALAMSSVLNRAAFPVVEVTRETAVNYLRKEVLMLPSDTPKGFVLITFRGVALGFVKNIGGRANNLYPAEWKIRTSHLVSYSLGDVVV